MKLEIKVIPNARRNQISGWINDRLKIKICKPPLKGQANKELIRYLAKEWEISKGCIIIEKGFKSSKKTINISSDKDIKLPPKPQKLI